MKKALLSIFYCTALTYPASLFYQLGSKSYYAFIRWASLAKARTLFPMASNLSIDLRTDIKFPENIKIGDGVIIGAGTVIGAMAPVEISKLVRISRGVTIETATLDFTSPLPYCHKARPIKLGVGVWLGSGAIVLGGVTIGDYAVIGAGAIVTKDVPSRAVIVGSAGHHIKDI